MKMIKIFIRPIFYWFQKRKALKAGNIIEPNAVITRASLMGKNRIYKSANVCDSTVGIATYVGASSNLANCIIGNFCSISQKVNVIVGTHPTSSYLSTHPAFFSTRKQSGFTFASNNDFEEFKYADEKQKKTVVIENDVWIGYGVNILQGITIGNGAIVASNALVTKDVPPYSIVGGVPAKIIKYRFQEDEITKLLKIQWWNKDWGWIKSNASKFANPSQFLREYDED